jgi:hypothetical protein
MFGRRRNYRPKWGHAAGFLRSATSFWAAAETGADFRVPGEVERGGSDTDDRFGWAGVCGIGAEVEEGSVTIPTGCWVRFAATVV